MPRKRYKGIIVHYVAGRRWIIAWKGRHTGLWKSDVYPGKYGRCSQGRRPLHLRGDVVSAATLGELAYHGIATFASSNGAIRRCRQLGIDPDDPTRKPTVTQPGVPVQEKEFALNSLPHGEPLVVQIDAEEAKTVSSGPGVVGDPTVLDEAYLFLAINVEYPPTVVGVRIMSDPNPELHSGIRWARLTEAAAPGFARARAALVKEVESSPLWKWVTLLPGWKDASRA